MRTEIIISIMAIAVATIFSIAEPSFFTYDTLVLVAILSAELGFIALGMSFLIATGEIDLSAAGVLALSVWVYDGFATGLGFSLPLAVVAVIALAISIGFIHGYICLRMGIPGFIVTFVGMIIWKGILTAITKGEHEGYLGDKTTLFTNVLQGYVGMVPAVFIWFIVFTVIFTILLTRTRFGSHVLAVGGNLTVARNIGVRIERTKILCFILSSLMAGVAAIFFFNRQFYVASDVMVEAPLFAICACVVGGCMAGRANIVGTSIGVITIIIIQRGLYIAGVPATLYMAAVGIVLLVFATIHIKWKEIHWVGVRRK
jgi:ribose/xylose/arabinose/galactoside ABC-type transport system permease subunit